MPTQVTLSWPANPAEEQVTNYVVLQSVNGGMETVVGQPTVPTLTLNDVEPGNYVWKVSAQNLAGSSPFSPAATNPAAPSTPPKPTVSVAVI